MPRTVVPPVPAPAMRAEPSGSTGDRLPEKLVKYVPAEVLAFFIPTSAAIGQERDTLLWTIIILSALGTPAYLRVTANTLPRHEKPRWFFYILSLLAYGAWAIGTSPNVAELLDIDDVGAGVVLASAVFLIPLADSALNIIIPPRPES